jgi:hypothetical protein
MELLMRRIIFILMTLVLTLLLDPGCAKEKWKVTCIEPQDDRSSIAASQPTTTQSAEPLNGEFVDEMDFFDCMLKKPRCTVGEAIRAVCLFVNTTDPGKNFDERYEFLLQRQIVRPAWKLEHGQWVDRGTLAYMLAKAGGIKGGINLRLFGSMGLGDRRYAYREMIYYNLMESGCDYQYVTGPELITVTGNVDRFVQERGNYSAGRETQLGERTQYQP